MHDEQPTAPAIPYGYCRCGCGERTNLAQNTAKSKGWVRGEPKHYVFGHSGRGRLPPLAELTREQAEAIRALRGTEPQRVTARRYGITRPSVSAIQCGRVWMA